MPTAEENIRRVLRHYGLEESLAITGRDPDRVWAWPRADDILRLVVLGAWTMDLREAAESMHGTASSFREPGGVSPALQVCFHRARGPDPPWPYFLEVDLDLAAPSWRRPVQLGIHGYEVLRNWLTHGTTDQALISRRLDERFRLGG